VVDPVPLESTATSHGGRGSDIAATPPNIEIVADYFWTPFILVTQKSRYILWLPHYI